MSRAGEKIVSGLKEALASVKCRHEWLPVSQRVKGGKVVGRVCMCAKCKTRRTEFAGDVNK